MVPLLWAVLAALVLFALLTLMKSPRHDRVWADDVRELPRVTQTEDGITIQNYRRWSYDAEGPTHKRWTDLAPFDAEDIKDVWFVVEPHPGMPGMAHTMVVFELMDRRLLGVSVEARKEMGEPYGLARGTFNGFELIYVWASPQDMFSRRVLVQDHDIYMYRLALKGREPQAYLGALIDKTIAIEARPRFYNTFGSNCTNELAKTAGLAWHPAFVLTGNSASALHKKERISAPDGFDTLKELARVTGTVRTYAGADEVVFNAALIDAASRQVSPRT